MLYLLEYIIIICVDSPLVVYFSGNGYIYDLFEVNSIICARMASYAEVRIVIMNMRLAPENKMPIPIYEAFDAVKAVTQDTKSLIFVGFCSGAACALVVAEMGYNTHAFSIDHLLLLNGIYDLSFGNKEYANYEEQDLSLSRELVDFLIEQQAIHPQELTHPIYSPQYYDDFSFLPKTSIIVAEYDRNRSSSEALYQKIKNNGSKSVHKIILFGQTQNSIIFYDLIKDIEDPAEVLIRYIDTN